MVKKCIYCKALLEDSAVLDVCDSCGYKVWGEKMLKVIKQSMENARDKGDLFQGSVTDSQSPVLHKRR